MKGARVANWHETVVTASDSNFDAALYLAVNADLRAAARNDPGFDPRAHFDRFGRQEKRKQLARRDPERMAMKFQRFQPILAPDDLEFMAAAGAFPVSFGTRHLDVSDYDSESANPGISEWFDVLRSDPNGRYLDVGAGFRPVVHDNCAYLDVYPSLTSDIVITPGRSLPFKDHVLDGLACLSVLEHVEDPFRLVDEMARVLKPGGRVFIDWPFLQPVHGYPSHYYNATRMGLARLFEDRFLIEKLYTNSAQGANFTLSWILEWFVQGMAEGPAKQAFLGLTVHDLLQRNPRDELYRECLRTMSEDMQLRLSCGNTLIGGLLAR